MNYESRAEITITNKFGNTLVYSGFVMGEPSIQQDGVYFRVFSPNKDYIADKIVGNHHLVIEKKELPDDFSCTHIGSKTVIGTKGNGKPKCTIYNKNGEIVYDERNAYEKQ